MEARKIFFEVAMALPLRDMTYGIYGFVSAGRKRAEKLTHAIGKIRKR